MSEIKILNKEKVKGESKNVQLPVNFVCIDEVSTEDAKIYIKKDVYETIEEFSRLDTTRERGGILLGDFVEHNGKNNVIVSAFVEAKYTDASASTLTFTHKTWDYIHEQQDKLYPDLKIVGWQHTHPSYGIFLSNYDIFIQENFFNLPWQIAYVVDPVADTRGFFQWKNDKVQKTGGFYIFDDAGKNIKIKKHKLNTDNKNKSFGIFNIILCTLTVLLAVGSIFFYFEKSNIKEQYAQLMKSNVQMLQENDQLAKENEELKKNFAQESKQESNIQSEDKEEKKSKIQDVSEEKDMVKFKIYTIKDGDTLQKICEENNLDYTSSKSMILKINSISDENKIISGEELYLPLQ